MKSILLIIVVFLLISCAKMDVTSKEDKYPTCFQSMINASNPPLEIWRYNYDNKLVYLVKPDCCDQYEEVYSSDCSKICAPSGGITGKGDGKCSAFYDTATEGTLVWKSN